MTAPATFSVALANETATAHLMADLALLVGPGDVITLSGDLGAGKTAAARAMIRYLAGDRRARSAEPDLHAGAELRSAVSACSRRSLPHQRFERAGGNRIVAAAGGHAGADRMAGARARRAARRSHRHRLQPSPGARIHRARRRNHRPWQGGGAGDAAGGACGSFSTMPACSMRSASACPATPRRAPMRG